MHVYIVWYISTQTCATQMFWACINMLVKHPNINIVQNETPNSLFIDGKTLYPKKQFHSSPSWVFLHLSGTTPPQYLKRAGEKDR